MSQPAPAAAAAAPTPNDVAPQGQQSQQPTDQQPTDQQPTTDGDGDDEGDKGFPADTPLKDMSSEQREAYWKDKARKHEARSKERVDPTEHQRLQERLQEFERASETDQQAALRQAREEAATEAVQGMHTRNAESMARMALRATGVQDDEEINTFIEETNFGTFIGADGAVDESRLWARVERYTGTGSAQQWPDMGQDRHGSASKESGSDLYDRLHGTK